MGSTCLAHEARSFFALLIAAVVRGAKTLPPSRIPEHIHVAAVRLKAYRARLQALDLRYNTFGYESKTTGERKARQQVRITNKGLTRLAEMIAAEAAERKLSAATPQHQHRLGLDPS